MQKTTTAAIRRILSSENSREDYQAVRTQAKIVSEIISNKIQKNKTKIRISEAEILLELRVRAARTDHEKTCLTMDPLRRLSKVFINSTDRIALIHKTS